jgi:hypothetical protein
VDKGNLYDPAVTSAFTMELRDAVAATHGRLHRDPLVGRAYGDWTADASPWLVAWIAGVEWDPTATAATDARNAGCAGGERAVLPVHSGRVADRALDRRPLDELAAAQAADGRSMPIAFVNWPTTDPLHHPEEPLVRRISSASTRTTCSPPGTGRRHVRELPRLPVLPDFQRHEPACRNSSTMDRRTRTAAT